MRLYTPDNLHYPIKVTKLLCRPGDDVKRDQTLFNYEYTSKVHESSAENPEGYEVERTWPARFESELEGKVNELTVAPGQILVKRALVADIEEPCKHEVQFGGICAICGTDVTTLSSYNSTIRDTDRATVNTVHGHTALLVSHSEASRADEEAKRRLLDTRKLSLVVDLDQTIIHATVDPTVAEWQQDPSNPNHAAVADVRAFNLIDDGPGARGCWYYIKLRPGLAEFLDTISKSYELHIYTMGTRAYAENIAKIIDPDRKIFADRILSRDESGSLTAKTLKRLFPVDTRMVVIIDDRGDVWQWSPNLIKVSAYDFFVGIGDINSSFLPKRAELESKPTKQPKTNGTNGEVNGDVSAVDQLVSMAGNQDAESMKEKTDEQDSALASQLADRPLMQKQKILDAADDEAKASPAAEAAVELLSEEQPESFDHPKYRHNLLQDDDTELIHLSSSLQQIHKDFFRDYDEMSGQQDRKNRDLQAIPDAADIMRSLKSRVLAGVHLVFSGVVPLGVNIYQHDTVIWAESFGARVSENITRRTTHVVASPERRTAKVRQAARKNGRISIVSVNWLMACFSQWQRVPEAAYRIHSDAERKDDLGGGLPDSFGDEDKLALSSSEEGDLVTEDETEDTGTPLNVSTAADELDNELAKYGPKMQREDSSPTATEQIEDWGDIDAELAEFLGSDADEDSDMESTRSNTLSDSLTPGKRKREEAESDISDAEGSRLQKRKKEALARTSSLVSVTTATNNRENAKRNVPTGSAQAEPDENDDLEAALAAELLDDDDD
ncbi:hypothetical protein AMS68_001120 [Peltaster fructicola]|uniref:RNA polymerase II subunit A C-terminal domain phosphatase n=1 Tax=Peltaster fructicola TaxID=286661 RepID=A0A6H0XLL1_9PEZI|nr:hypothetical protein AMS68_001120 [Peltaster fructicola]